MSSRTRTCPHCGEATVYRSHRRSWLEHLVSFFGFFPHRCDRCDERFFAQRA